jgi:hypothetical protein
MLPSPRESMESVRSAAVAGGVRLRRFRLAAIALAGILWVSCSAPEAFHAGMSGLSSSAGANGAAGTPGAAGTSGPGTAGSAGPSGAAGMTALPIDAGAAGTSAGGTTGADAAAGTTTPASGTAGTTAPTSGTAGTGAAGTGAAGTVGAAGTGAAGTVAGTSGAAGTTAPTAPLALPFAVTDHFNPTGAMNDAIVLGAVTTTTDVTACAGVAAGANPGLCFTITYHPQIVAPATTSWGGVYWQYPDNNWGALAPLHVASGAKDVSFWAKGMAGGESITFQSGGIMNAVSVTTPFTDAFKAVLSVTLTTAWKKYTIPLTGMSYDAVLGGFAWVATASSATPMTFYLDGIVWE